MSQNCDKGKHYCDAIHGAGVAEIGKGIKECTYTHTYTYGRYSRTARKDGFRVGGRVKRERKVGIIMFCLRLLVIR